jgi:hypothetical protein
MHLGAACAPISSYGIKDDYIAYTWFDSSSKECHDYVLNFAERTTPFGVYALWAKSMRLGRTLSYAMKINESKFRVRCGALFGVRPCKDVSFSSSATWPSS